MKVEQSQDPFTGILSQLVPGWSSSRKVDIREVKQTRHAHVESNVYCTCNTNPLTMGIDIDKGAALVADECAAKTAVVPTNPKGEASVAR